MEVILMGLTLDNLEEARRFMLEEIALDINEHTLYISTRLTATGKGAFPDLLRQAADQFNDDWLADQLNHGLLNATLEARKPKGGYYTKRMPIDAHETLAEGEFNRFYARGLCRYAIEHNIPALEIYRAKAVMTPRSASEAKRGQMISAEALLRDLRTSQGMDTALGLPPGPNSGLSVRLR